MKNKMKKNEVPTELWSYAELVPPILDALKSITGKVFTGYQDFEKWWTAEGKDFEVID